MNKFRCGNFSCDVEQFHKDAGKGSKRIIRLFDKSMEEDLHFGGYLFADPGYGFLCINWICSEGILISGYLSKKEFSSELVVDKLLEYLEAEIPDLKNVDVRYHIECVDFKLCYEYNGEY